MKTMNITRILEVIMKDLKTLNCLREYSSVNSSSVVKMFQSAPKFIH